MAVAVHPDLEYTTISYEKDGEKFVSVVAVERVEAVAAKAGNLKAGSYRVGAKTVKGRSARRIAVCSSICGGESNG